MVEHIVDVAVLQVFDEVVISVDVHMLPVVEEVDEVAQISPERIREHIAFKVP